MIKICSWCYTGYEEDSTDENQLCLTCRSWSGPMEGIGIKEFLDRFPKPVFVVNDSDIIVSGNQLACELAGKEFDAICDQHGGDIFECENARLPGGCGNTTHCKDCTIRRTVMATIATGEAFDNVLAYEDLITPNGPQRMEVLISTALLNNYVLLRINNLKLATA